MTLWLGIHHTDWLEKVEVPTMVSFRRLKLLKSFPRAAMVWMQDSGGFTEVKDHGRYLTSPPEYVRRTRVHMAEIGNLQWAAIQDWMCEEVMLARTGLTVMQHQQRTVESYLDLRELAPDINWLPVLQGQTFGDYRRHLEMYAQVGVDLLKAKLVGLGTVCSRQRTLEAARLVRQLAGLGLRLHGFGMKITSVLRLRGLLPSADSMAWSFDGRMPQGGRCSPNRDHDRCANCLAYALKWYWRLVTRLEQTPMLPCIV